MQRGPAFGVLSMPVGDIAAKRAIKAAGCTHNVIAPKWGTMQPNGPGTALDATAVAGMLADFDQCAQLGLKVMFEAALHYPPTWVLSGANAVEAFKDQAGNVFDQANAAVGKRTANWMWTARGRTYVADFLGKLAAALGPARRKQIVGIKMGGGYYGEAHYPTSVVSGTPYSWWYFGDSMQTGNGLASDLTPCPLPGYVVFSGTDAQDVQVINWYLNGLSTWVNWYIATMRAAGFTGCDYHVCHPGSGVRNNQGRTGAGFRQAAACGEDPGRLIGSYAKDPHVWPYCTWLNNNDYQPPAKAESDLSAWKKVYLEAVRWNKHHRLYGENTGNENAQGLRDQFAGYAHGSALSNAPWSSMNAPQGTFGFQGMFWLNYASLTDGNPAHAQMADLAAAIKAHVTSL